MSGTVNVLVVDDDAVDRKLIRRLLRQCEPGVRVTEACHSEQAAAALVGDPQPDCVFLDYLLPGKDGLALVRELRAAKNTVPIIVLTGQGDERVAVETLKAGATEYLPKDNLNAEVIGRTLRNALRIVSAERQRSDAQAALERTNRQISNILSGIAEPFFAVGNDGALTYVNEAFAHLVDREEDWLLGRSACDMLIGIADALAEEVELTRLRGTAVNVEWCLEEDRRWYDSYLHPNKDGLSVYSRDITERKAAEADLQFQANHDPLTRLPNRGLLLDRLRQLLARVACNGRQVGVLFCDLDRFKLINDSMGHHVGDELLREFAQRLQNTVRGGDTVARLSGDEFVVLLDDVAATEDVERVADKLCQCLSAPYHLAGQDVVVTSSIGASIYPVHGRRPEVLLRNADVAMYAAKSAGKNRFVVYSPQMASERLKQLEIEQDLRRALKHNQFRVHYQPIVNLQDRSPAAMEALIRWEHPQLGLLAPDRFLAVAEDSGLIVPIGEWLLDDVCRALSQWRRDGIAAPRVAVNLSERQLHDANLVDSLTHVLNEHRLTPADLELEVTENIVMSDDDAAAAQLLELRGRGVQIAVDDFGTGHSSLLRLKQLPLDVIKIDRSFVAEITSRGDDAAITGAIVALAQELGMQTVAEGIETEAQAAWLSHKRCDRGQGYLFSRPLPEADVPAALEDVACEAQHA